MGRVMCAAIRTLAPKFVGRSLRDITANFAKTHRDFVGGQIRFMSPERGVLQCASRACLNAICDLWAKSEGKPLWKLVCDFTPEEFVARIDFRYITDLITPEEAIGMLRETKTKAEGGCGSAESGCTGLQHEDIQRLLHLAIEEGFTNFKLRVGRGVPEDRKRLQMIRSIVGPDAGTLVISERTRDVPQAPAYLSQLADFKIKYVLSSWAVRTFFSCPRKSIEEPTSPGRQHVNNRIFFKQFRQAEAVDVINLDAVRVSGVNEVLSILLMAAKCGVGMTEVCSHISTIDYIAVSGKQSMMEYTRHLHESFEHPALIDRGYHVSPPAPGYSSDLQPEVFDQYACPSGTFWKSEKGQEMQNDPWRGCVGEQTS
ncbi:enolase C-terminal domain-like protein [Calocera viscosa TUFC12733]|uniref:Enolase C-terminal domain-like protein n=1 Tax=Calocera viscosa (strain TUFC12733) TaxID=1330018 RepID=A0A167PF88_CALVF|nr:enolase C-terminal domain-like protein [Calocera viscosa TUFC12733]